MNHSVARNYSTLELVRHLKNKFPDMHPDMEEAVQRLEFGSLVAEPPLLVARTEQVVRHVCPKCAAQPLTLVR